MLTRFPYSADMRYLDHMDIQTKREILQVAKTELMRHSWDTFCDSPPSVAQGGRGVIVRLHQANSDVGTAVGVVGHFPITRRDIKGRPFGVGFECLARTHFGKERPQWIA